MVNDFNAGIYKITTLHNNKFYIGSSVYLRGRKFDHFTRFKANKHANNYMQKVYNKYGKENFKFEYLINCPKEYLIKLEQWFIDNQNPHYNMQRIAGGSALGLKRTKETCTKISNALKGKKLTDEHKLNMSKNKKSYKGKIYQYDKFNNLIMIWDKNIVDIERDLNICKGGVTKVLMNKRKTTMNFIFKYEKEVLNGL